MVKWSALVRHTKAGLEALSWFELLTKGAGVASGLVIAVGAVWSAIGHDLAWPFVVLLLLIAMAVPFWCVRQVLLLFGTPTVVRADPADYAYCLAFTSISIGHDDDGVQVGVGLQNASTWPLEYKVETFHVVIADRAVPNPTFPNSGGIIPRAVGRTYWYPAFTAQELRTGKKSGAISFVISYGAPASAPRRVLKMAVDITIEIAQDGSVKSTNRITSERETEYIKRD